MRAPLPRRRNENLVDQAIDLAIMVGLGVLILVGFATSYRTLRDLAASEGSYPVWLAPAVPLSFDLGIVVLSLKVARAAREGRTAPVLRLLVAALSAATVVANAASATSPTARLLHAVPPAMFVVCFETVVISSRRTALEARGLLPSPLPRLRPVRWVLAFPSSWRRWRLMVLELDPPTGASGPLSRASVPAVEAPAKVVVSATPIDPARDPQKSLPPPVAGRDEVAAKLLSDSPHMSTAELVRQLGAAGWQVSSRTAQRIRGRHAP